MNYPQRMYSKTELGLLYFPDTTDAAIMKTANKPKRNFFNIGACICWATWTSATTHNLLIRNIITYIYYFLICN